MKTDQVGEYLNNKKTGLIRIYYIYPTHSLLPFTASLYFCIWLYISESHREFVLKNLDRIRSKVADLWYYWVKNIERKVGLEKVQ